MPRGQKSKQRTRKKRHHTQHDSQGPKGEKDSVAVEEEAPCSSNPVLDDIPKNSFDSESCSTSREPCITSSTITLEDNDDTKWDEGDNRLEEENSDYSEYLYSTESPCGDCLAMNVAWVEQFLLYKFKMKQPITKEDLLNIVDQNYQHQFPEILKRASDNIEIVFAVEVKEVDTTNHLYDLVSKLKLPNNGRVCAGRGLPKTGLLMAILSMIFMNGNCAAEEEMWSFLGMMGIYPGRKHNIFREPRKLITKDLVRLKYLESRQVPNSDPPRYEFLWGPKAFIETSKMSVLQYIAKANNTEPSAYSEQYEEALREQVQKAQVKLVANPVSTVVTTPDTCPYPAGSSTTIKSGALSPDNKLLFHNSGFHERIKEHQK